MRRTFIVVGRTALASGDFRPDDVPGTSGRLDVLLRCIRTALLVSHGVRRDTVLYLVLGGDPDAPRTLRIAGADAKFLRPDERSLATLIAKTLASQADRATMGFVQVRPGIAIAQGGVVAVLGDVGDAPRYVLVEGGPDLRGWGGLETDATFFVGDHLGFDDSTLALLADLGAHPVGLGPVSLHAEDAIVVVHNELDRRSLHAS